MWDSDTLAQEAKGLGSALEIVTGRFERYPPEYYLMRLERVSQELQMSPTELALYDDAGVASDRLGKPDKAIEWMERKRAELDKLDQPDREHEYRYHANLGTFLAHRWLKERVGDDLQRAEEHIAKAIEINPDAHFGREIVQLEAIRWIRAREANELADDLGTYLLSKIDPDKPEQPITLEKLIEGLQGLIVLGAAQESVDIHAALAHALAEGNVVSGRQDAVVGYMAELRVDELMANGAKPLYTETEYKPAAAVIQDHRVPVLRRQYQDLRRQNERWAEQREKYMLERLRNGLHPDTHPEFWAGYREKPMHIPPESPVLSRGGQILTFVAAAAFVLVAIAAGVVFARRAAVR